MFWFLDQFFHKALVCWIKKRMFPKTGSTDFSVSSGLQTTSICPSHPARLWSQISAAAHSWRWLWFLTSPAWSSSSSGSSPRWASGTFLWYLDLCWSSWVWSSGYSGTWGTWLCLRRSSTYPNMTSCNYSVSETGLSRVWVSFWSLSSWSHEQVKLSWLCGSLELTEVLCFTSKSGKDQEHIWLLPGQKENSTICLQAKNKFPAHWTAAIPTLWWKYIWQHFHAFENLCQVDALCLIYVTVISVYILWVYIYISTWLCTFM